MKDRRVAKSLNLIKASYLRLSKTKPKRNISVSDICNDADINRGTFYKYYLDIFHLQETLEVEAAKKIAQAILGEYQFDGNSDNIVDSLFACIKANPEDSFLLFGSDTSPIQSNYGLDWLRAYLEEQALPHWIKSSNVTEPEARIIFNFMVNNVFYLLKMWVAEEIDIDEARFKELYLNLINHGVYHYIYK